MGLALPSVAYRRASAGTGVAFWLWQGMQGSQQGNSGYLMKSPAGRPGLILMSKPIPENRHAAGSRITEPGAGALCLAGLDPDSPPLAWRYGLYSVPP